MRLLQLEVLDFDGPARWRWRLTDLPGGRFLADHQVDLDQTNAEYEAFTDLDAYLRWNAAPDRRLESEAELLTQVGGWIGEQVLGPVGPAILNLQPATVRLVLPPEAAVLAYRPLELAHVEGRPLAVQQVSLVVQPAGPATDGGRKAGVRERLRMLAIFSLPIDASALNLRHERYSLARLVHHIAQGNGKAVELRVLQYGVTRQRLGEMLVEADGWDLVHISGHGLPAGLLLELEDGRRDLVASAELVALLEPAADRIKLVVMSSCDSAAVTAAEQLRLLGIPPPGQPTPDAASTEAEPLPALAAELVGRLDCAVLAMRYPVIDDFAIGLAGQLYELLLGKGQPLARALQLALPRLISEPPTAAVPALSVATPALFGARAAELRLVPPAGEPLVFDTMVTKLAGFPPEPVRFVGRVGPMARANAALAPGSQHSGVLLFGMAGAGKTACALELAYGHEQAFRVLVWHKAPDEDHDFTAALTNFALDLERKLPGLQLAHLVDDQAALAGFLPQLTEFLERRRVLVVLDNLESLLTERGDWRDERWGPVVEALVGHDGLSRVILTSRRRPRVLDTRVLIEPIHALSLDEAVLLARELPHLRALLDGIAGLDQRAGRALVARTLAVVQGHPKLIELADGQAADPGALEARLGEADRAWLAGGTRVEAFLEQGESAAGEQDYLRVLEGWTRAVTTDLPEAATTLFHLLCCLEDDDRLSRVVDGNWADMWRRLERPGEPPDLAVAVALLLEQGLVAVARDDEGQPARYLLHPGVAAAGRAAAGAGFQAAVDEELAAFWVRGFQVGIKREGEELGWLVLRAGRSATPYLLRRQQWNQAGSLLERVLNRDRSPETVAGLLPVLRRIAEATIGTDDELRAGRLLALALAEIRPAEAEPQLRGLLATAVAQGHLNVASGLAGDLVDLLRKAGRLDDALALAEQKQTYTRRADLGPWTQLLDEAQRLQILDGLGRSQEVLDRVAELQQTMAGLPEHPAANEQSDPLNVREVVLGIGRTAARNLNRWEEALALNAEQLAAMRRRDALALEVARSAFNDYASLLRLGRLHEARQLLLACRDVFDNEHDVGALGKTLSALADLEDELGHRNEAIRLGQDALRYGYLAGDPAGVAVRHFNLANYLQQAGRDPATTLAHRLACAVVEFQMGSGGLAMTVRRLARDLASLEHVPPVAGSFAALCALVEQVPGVRLAALVQRLPTRAADGEAALAEALRLARELPPDQIGELQRHIAWWNPVLAGLVAAAAGDPQAAEAVGQTLATRGQQADWAALAAVLGRILGGERDQQLLDGLDPIDTAIAQRALDALASRVQLAPASWQTLTSPALPDQLAGLAGTVVAAARGDQQAAAELEPVLTDLAAQADWATLAGVLRRVLAGERDQALTQGLDETDTAVVTVVLDQLVDQPNPIDQ
jgi:tetratricopeptide (TPR) repeat protein